MHLPDLLFNKGYLSDSLRNQEQVLVQKIHGEKAAYITTVNEEAYVQHVLDSFAVAPLQIDHEGISVSPPFDKEVTVDDWGRRITM